MQKQSGTKQDAKLEKAIKRFAKGNKQVADMIRKQAQADPIIYQAVVGQMPED